LHEALSLVDTEEGSLAAGVLNNMAGLAHERGDTERAAVLYGQALEAAIRTDDRWHIAAVYTNLGNLASDRGDLERARDWLEQGLAVSRELGDTRVAGMNLNVLGEVFRLQGSLHDARAAFRDGLRYLDEMGDWPNLAYSLDCLARVARDEAGMRRAARLVGAADAIRLSLGITMDDAMRAARDRVLADCERVLGSDETAAARAAGATISLREAVAYGLSDDEEGDVRRSYSITVGKYRTQSGAGRAS
jgi:ATP/maltotriose-dependent transcriptional regulator MalT